MTASGPKLSDLVGLFPTTGDFSAAEVVTANEVPPPYHQLLVHDQHMTVTVEAHHGDLVDVRILDRRHTGDVYARKILLALQKTGRIVQYGIVKIDFRHCSTAVRDRILAGDTPLGRILIEHDVLRRIEPTSYLRLTPGPAVVGWFGLTGPEPCYGRLAYIHCNEQPAIELLEVVVPE